MEQNSKGFQGGSGNTEQTSEILTPSLAVGTVAPPATKASHTGCPACSTCDLAAPS